MSEARVSRLRIHPIKSFNPVEVAQVEMGIRSLKNDRLFAMVDENGRYINGKRTNQVNLLKVDYDLKNNLVTFSRRDKTEQNTFTLAAGDLALEEYLSHFFEMPVNLIQDTSGKFMDIPGASSITVVSEASLKFLQKDTAYDLENIRLRFRSNIELVGVESFWEENLFQSPGVGIKFRIGAVEMIGISPRARCNVPPQHPLSGEFDYFFVKNMIATRNKSLPSDSTLLQYGKSTYFLTVNVYLPDTEIGKVIEVGDKIEIIGPVDLVM